MAGVPLDLRHQRGLSLIAGLVKEPKETDDFTKNLVSLTLSHVKVEVDFTKEVLYVVEYERDNGEVVEFQVDYPWLPPKCSHCHELGHIANNCLLLPIPPRVVPPPAANEQVIKEYIKKKATTKTSKDSTTPKSPSKVMTPTNGKTNVPSIPEIFSQAETQKEPAPVGAAPTVVPDIDPPIVHSSPTKKPPSSLSIPLKVPCPKPSPPVIIALPATITPSGEPYPYSPPVSTKKASLKRSRSNPTLCSSRLFPPLLIGPLL